MGHSPWCLKESDTYEVTERAIYCTECLEQVVRFHIRTFV